MKVCGKRCRLYSRVTGFFQPVTQWNDGKQEEFRERQVYSVNGSDRRANQQIQEKA